MVAFGSLRTTFAVRPSANLSLKRIAERWNTSITGVVLAWTLAKGVAAIPRSTSEAHLAANLAIGGGLPRLDDDDMDDLDSMQLKEPRTSYAVLLSQSQHWSLQL